MKVLSEAFVRVRLETIETLISIYSDRDRKRLQALELEKKTLEAILLDYMTA